MSMRGLTKEGRRFLLAILLIGIASFNTGNNLIYLIFSLMLSLMIVSILYPLVNLSMLRMDVRFHEPLFANEDSRIVVAVTNRKWFSSYSVALELPFEEASRIYMPVLKRGFQVIRFDHLQMKRRGRYSMHAVRLSTGFPFIFLYKDRSLREEEEFIVYPQIRDVSRIVNTIEADRVEREEVQNRHEGDYFLTREYVYGEESRRIDWKSSAKTQKTMVKEFARSDDRLATVILDNGVSGGEDDFERSVSIAASLVMELIVRGYYVRLITCRKVVPYGNGQAHLSKILDILAEISLLGTAECPVRDLPEGLSILVPSSIRSGFSDLAPLCSGVVDARDL